MFTCIHRRTPPSSFHAIKPSQNRFARFDPNRFRLCQWN